VDGEIWNGVGVGGLRGEDFGVGIAVLADGTVEQQIVPRGTI